MQVARFINSIRKTRHDSAVSRITCIKREQFIYKIYDLQSTMHETWYVLVINFNVRVTL